MIELKNISKTFKIAKRSKGFFKSFISLFHREYLYKHALKNVSFSIADGEIVGYIGPNGAGKSTTIKIMCGILSPDSGTCVVDGLVPWKNRIAYVRQIGAVFGQRSNLNWDVPIIDSFELLKQIYKIPEEKYRSNLDMLTKKLQIEDLLNTPLRQLSLGQKMRCEIAAALLHSPKILFLDEPTIGLDSNSKLAVRKFIKEINAATKVTVILTTHDMNDIEALTDRVILVGKGEILFDGSFETIKKKYGKTKDIEVEFEQDYDTISLPGYEVLQHNGKTAVLRYQGAHFNLAKLVFELEKNYLVSDINVSMISVEEIIAQLYQEYQL